MKARKSADSGPADLLLSCLSTRVELALTSEVGRWSQEDWNGVANTAADHGVAPLLFKRLKESAARAKIPTGAWEQLRLAYFVSGERNRRLYRELQAVLRCLRSNGIPVIALKGAYLAEAIYGDIALRPMGDVDLMVPEADLLRTRAALLDPGRVHQRSGDIESHCRRMHHLPQVVVRGLPVEIHWTITGPGGPFRIGVAGLWHRARPAVIAGVEVLALSPEDSLLHLCLHVCHQHGLVGLRAFCDIAETIHHCRGELDWPQLADRAREWGATRYVGLTLCLVGGMLGEKVPDDVLGRLIPAGLDQRLLETARQSVLARTGYGPWVPLFHLRGARSLGDKAKLSWLRVFLSPGEIAAMYPAARDSKLIYFYYALRFGDALRKLAVHALRRGWLLMRSRGRDQHASLFNWLNFG